MRHTTVTQPGMQKDEMYLHRRNNGFYYFRRRVPSDLIGVIDPKEFQYSLGTNVRRDASALEKAAHFVFRSGEWQVANVDRRHSTGLSDSAR